MVLLKKSKSFLKKVHFVSLIKEFKEMIFAWLLLRILAGEGKGTVKK